MVGFCPYLPKIGLKQHNIFLECRKQLQATTTDKQQLKHKGLNTQANKLNKITRGGAN